MRDVGVRRRPAGGFRYRSLSAALGIAAAVALGSTSCAHFDESGSAPFHAAPPFGSAAQVQPQLPATPPPSAAPPASPGAPPPQPGPCVDPDPNVVATCLAATGGLTMLPDGTSALVAERTTGNIVRVGPGQVPTVVATIPVDPTGDGGLTAIALSPTYGEDRLIYAYVTTPTDNRVVRIAPGDVPKTILSGIPRGGSGNAGGLLFTDRRTLLVLTGDAGDPAAATDPASLAGKLLRLTALAPAETQAPQQLASGIGTAGGLCGDPQTGAVWLTDRGDAMDRLQRVSADGTGLTTVWTWPDRPGVGGCATNGGVVAVALTDGKALAALSISKQTGAVLSQPVSVAENKYGRLGSAALGPDGAIWVATVNKSGGTPGPTDDRVVRIPLPNPTGGRD